MTPSKSIVLLLCLAGCAPIKAPTTTQAPTTPALTYLGQAHIAPGATFDGTVIGGLSGISYDPGRDCYYVISDDRSETSPARFYTVRLALSGNGIDDLTVTAVHPLRAKDGQPFPPLSLGPSPPSVPPDPEGIAFDATRQRLYWSSEGERRTDAPPVLADPWVRTAGLGGGYLGEFTMPPQLAMSAQHTGPRRNKTLEGLTLTPDGATVFAAMEAPGYDDGDPPEAGHGALVRVTAFDLDPATASGEPAAQYAYPLEPAPERAPDASNGLTDLVALSDTEFLVVERAFSVHTVDRQQVRVFRAEIGAATDVLAVPSLTAVPVTPMTKTLLADLAATPEPAPLGNVEGITLGPRLPDGRQAVVLVSDDNFTPTQVTQFLVFAM